MARPPKLTQQQKDDLRLLEPALRRAVSVGAYEDAKTITLRIQNVLKPTGHITRLMQAKNWLFEAAMEAGKLQIAISGLSGVISSTQSSTRVNLEARALLAICHLRRNDLEAAQPIIQDVLQSDKVIKSVDRRQQFRTRALARFEEEGVLASLRGHGNEVLQPTELQTEAGSLLASGSSVEELYERLGGSIPRATVNYLLKIDNLAKRQLPPSQVKCLPPPEEITKRGSLGKTAFKPLQRVVWRSLCDSESEVYKAWFDGGMKAVLNKVYIAGAVTTALANLKIGLPALAVPAIAIIMKMGIEVYCEAYKPETIMISKKDKS